MPKIPELKDAEAVGDTVDMLNARCERLVNSGKEDDALKCYDSMMKTFGPSYKKANLMKGFILINKKKYEEAKKCFGEVEKITPGTADAKVGLAICEAGLGQKGNARKLIGEALEIAPKDIAVLVSASLLYYDLGEKENGLEYLRRALKISPYTATYHLEIALKQCLSDPTVSQEDKDAIKADLAANKKILDEMRELDKPSKKK